MRGREFGTLVAGDPSLLRLVEVAVVDTHRRWHDRGGHPWSEPDAYRWLRYEDADPIGRLRDGLARLAAEGLQADPRLARRALAAASLLGYPRSGSGR